MLSVALTWFCKIMDPIVFQSFQVLLKRPIKLCPMQSKMRNHNKTKDCPLELSEPLKVT